MRKQVYSISLKIATAVLCCYSKSLTSVAFGCKISRCHWARRRWGRCVCLLLISFFFPLVNTCTILKYSILCSLEWEGISGMLWDFPENFSMKRLNKSARFSFSICCSSKCFPNCLRRKMHIPNAKKKPPHTGLEHNRISKMQVMKNITASASTFQSVNLDFIQFHDFLADARQSWNCTKSRYAIFFKAHVFDIY